MSRSMRPIILVALPRSYADEFIENQRNVLHVQPHHILIVSPSGKEFAIQQIRMIKNELMYRSEEPRLLILESFDTASYEAQNAFLKSLEQPPSGLQIILVVQNPFLLLPTVRSRAAIHRIAAPPPQQDSITEVSTALNQLVDRADLSVLAGSALSIKTYSDPTTLIDAVIAFFRTRLPTDTRSSRILKSALTYRSMILVNHADPQNVIDQLVLSIHKVYTPKPSV